MHPVRLEQQVLLGLLVLQAQLVPRVLLVLQVLRVQRGPQVQQLRVRQE